VTIYEVFDADVPAVKEGKLTTLPVFLEIIVLTTLLQMHQEESRTIC
jgi:hypothetical protein